jgi:putative transposase
MKAHQAAHSIATLCRVLGVSASGYYAWRVRRVSRRAHADGRLLEQIRACHQASGGTYGAPRLLRDLRAIGVRVGRKRVARLLKHAGLQGVSRRKRPRTTVRAPQARPAPDLVQRQFAATGPNQLWVADITYIPTGGGMLFLAVVLDVWSRRVIGWAMTPHLRTELVLAALNMAIDQRQPRGVIHHSDQGSQYTALGFGSRCREAGVRPSMGSVGDCYDNALCESFFATLECELLGRTSFPTRHEARLAVFSFIEGWYNARRRHSALDYESPLTFERQHAAATLRATRARPVEAAGPLDAGERAHRSLENAQHAFPTAPTGQ